MTIVKPKGWRGRLAVVLLKAVLWLVPGEAGALARRLIGSAYSDGYGRSKVDP